jgi:hypothetical protein
MTIREALGGPWVSHWLVWVALYPPTTLLVLMRETNTPFPHWWWPLLSATIQHLAVGLVIIVGAALARRRGATMPLSMAVSIWAAAAVARGLIAGAIAQSAAGAEPEYAYRIIVWVVASCLWIPPLVYVMAQFDHRRLLLGALDDACAELERRQCASAESGDEVQQKLRESVRATLQPVLDDLQASLANSRGALTRERVAELSAQLSHVHDDVAALVDSAGTGYRSDPEGDRRASVRRAFDIPPERPGLTSLLVVIATIALVAPDSWRVFGALAAVEVSVSTIVAGVLLAVVPLLARRFGRSTSVFPGQSVTVLSLVLALAAVTYIMLNSGIDPITWHGLIIVPLLAVALILANTVFALANTLWRSNDETTRLVSDTTADVEALRARHSVLEHRERTRLAHLMHGPIQGRLAACVMALNFHVGSQETPDEHESFGTMMDSVLHHLHDVSVDLVALADPELEYAPEGR